MTGAAAQGPQGAAVHLCVAIGFAARRAGDGFDVRRRGTTKDKPADDELSAEHVVRCRGCRELAGGGEGVRTGFTWVAACTRARARFAFCARETLPVPPQWVCEQGVTA